MATKESGGTSTVLDEERKRASFVIEKMTNILDGGEKKTQRRRFILSPTKEISLEDKHNWETGHEMLKNHVKHFIQTHQGYWDSFIPTREDIAWMSEYSMLSGAMMNHYGLFMGTIVGQGTEEQKMMWAMPAWQMKIIGCYAQTELGHGSNVRGLQTIAEYDKKTQQFILNTPTLLSIKWWPGALGKIATHAVVYAQLLLDGKEYGVHPFVVQIRDENHKPMPGLELGDLGPKLGDHANDTGYMKMDNVRIPREFMLAKYQEVTPDGQYVKSQIKEKNSKLHYLTMLNARGSMIKASSGNLAKAVTIATRYSCIRTQGFVSNKRDISFKSPEKKIIDYRVQQYRIFRQLALTYAIKFTGRWMLNKFKDLEGNVQSLKDDFTVQNVDALPEISATAGALKALCTFLASQGIEDCRKCCGGNGYLMSSGVASLAADYVWQTTAEGDWIVLMLTTAKHLIKSFGKFRSGESAGGVVYFKNINARDLAKDAPPPVTNPEDFINLDYLSKLFKHCALVHLVTVADDIATKMKLSQVEFEDACNTHAIALINYVRIHCFEFMLRNFIEEISREAEDKACNAALVKVCALFAVSNIIDDANWNGILPRDQVRLAERCVNILLEQLRPDSVALVDAFDIPDRVLNSTIGRYDGNIYEALYEAAKKAPLNKTDPFDGYHEYLKPHLDIEFLKQGNTVPKANL